MKARPLRRRGTTRYFAKDSRSQIWRLQSGKWSYITKDNILSGAWRPSDTKYKTQDFTNTNWTELNFAQLKEQFIFQ